MAQTKQYVLGRGKLYFARFKEGTQEPDGFLYFGNTPEFSLTIESEDLPHYDADEGVREEDDSVTLEVTRTGSLVTDNINPENVALFLLGSSTALTQAPVAAQTEVLAEIKAGHSYELGQDDVTNPSGYAGIDPLGFAVTIGTATAATGTVTVEVAENADDGNTVTVGTRTYTLVTALAGPNQVLIGADRVATAANLVAAITGGAGEGTVYSTGMAPHAEVTASAVAGVVTVTAQVPGASGNSIALSVVGDHLTASGAALSGGAGTALQPRVDYNMDFDAGVLSFVDGSAVAVDGASVNVTYAVRGSTRSVVLSGNQPVEGAMIFVTKNPKGPDSKLRMAWVKLSPNGDYNLKGDEWQQIPLTVRVMKREGLPAFRRDGKPVYQ